MILDCFTVPFNESLLKAFDSNTKVIPIFGINSWWEFEDEYDEKLVKKYHLYSCNPSSKNGTVSWKKVGIIDSIKLPIKVTLSDFKSGTTYFFSVRGEDHNNGFGCYSKVEQIHL